MINLSPPRSEGSVRIWRFNLAHELTAAAVAVLALAAGSWFILDQLERRYFQLHQQDAERVGQLLQQHLLEARHQLDRFAALPADRQGETTQLLLPAFSDLYRLNSSLDVLAVLKAGGGSRVFPGFSFAGSHIHSYLQQPSVRGAASSTIDRGVEDERASVYFSGIDRAGQRLLARLNLSYLQNFLSRYQRATGFPLLLVSRHGFVLLASDPELQVPAVDLRQVTSQAPSSLVRDQSNQGWLPLATRNSDLGGHIVILIPADHLAVQRRLVWCATLAVAGVVLLVLLWKNRRLQKLLFNPVAQFSDQIDQVRTDVSRGELPPFQDVMVPSRFQELTQIENSFEALIDTIRARDLTLQQKLRTSLTAAAIAHEINLPLSTIRLLCQQADQELQQGGLAVDRTQALVQELQSQSQQVSRVIERMRMLLRNVQTDLATTDLAAVVKGSLTLLKRPIRESQIRLHCEEVAQGELTVMGDAAQLQIALSNLLRNAIEAVAHQPLAQRLVKVTLDREGDTAIISVADSGRGFQLPPDVDTLYRSTKADGSGLGLFVARTCMTNHRGRLVVGRSPELGGAEFRLELPLVQSVAPTR